MQVTERLIPVATQEDDAQKHRLGPCLISPALFKQVAGGAPKGGWDDPTLVAATIEDPFAPKGGW